MMAVGNSGEDILISLDGEELALQESVRERKKAQTIHVKDRY